MPLDDLDIAQVEIHDSPDVRGWAVTTAITGIAFKGDAGVLVDFTKRDGAGSWPDVTPPGWSGPIEFTVWIFLKIGGAWHAAGILQCFRAADGSPSPNGGDIGAPGQVPKNWLYDQRWGAMRGYQPSRDEPVGFMVTAGDARGPGDVTLRERSNIVLVPFPPAGESAWTALEDAPAPPAVPSAPGSTPIPVPPAGDLSALEELVKQAEDLSLARHHEVMDFLENLTIVGTVKIPYIGMGALNAGALKR